MGEAICAAAALVASGDTALVGIVVLSLLVSLSAVALATLQHRAGMVGIETGASRLANDGARNSPCGMSCLPTLYFKS